ncbi:hypothetical protein [Pseudomonas serbica]|uniref:hypothetical protein n=1 Tax=Pseudomonas serbica TaxID=2965074 RepID=UPI00237BA8B3|nr:hypothetical protein [Pseudomonas serbica]
MDTTQQAVAAPKPAIQERWVLVPVQCDENIAAAISNNTPGPCNAATASLIWNAAVTWAPSHPLSQNPHGVERMKVCRPGYLGPANLMVVDAGDYDALLALLDDPDYPAKHARRLIAELREKVAQLEGDKKNLQSELAKFGKVDLL